jgi:hypothetical protein
MASSPGNYDANQVAQHQLLAEAQAYLHRSIATPKQLATVQYHCDLVGALPLLPIPDLHVLHHHVCTSPALAVRTLHFEDLGHGPYRHSSTTSSYHRFLSPQPLHFISWRSFMYRHILSFDDQSPMIVGYCHKYSRPAFRDGRGYLHMLACRSYDFT